MSRSEAQSVRRIFGLASAIILVTVGVIHPLRCGMDRLDARCLTVFAIASIVLLGVLIRSGHVAAARQIERKLRLIVKENA